LVRDELEREVDYFHRRLFGREAPAEVRERYVAAHRHLPVARGTGAVDIGRIVALGLDPEAIEFRLRRRDPGNLLSRKFRILIYLVEIRPECYPLVVREKGSLPGALFLLLHHGCRSAWKLLKGYLQVRIHHVA
jgi:hypothetical protein